MGISLHCTTSISLIAFPQIFNDELFGAVAEEKEVKGIVSKLMEARHSKSMDSYEVLARFCSRESITKLILPLKEVSKGALQQVFTYRGGWCRAEVSNSNTQWGQNVKLGQSLRPMSIFIDQKKSWTFLYGPKLVLFLSEKRMSKF